MINFIKKFFKNNEKGQSLVELLVAIGLATLLLPALLTGISASRGGRAQHDQRLQASSYLRQAQEAVRSIAQQGWSGIATNGTYYPEISGNSWILTPGTQDLNGLSLGITISDTYRDSSGAIVESGGTIDPSTKKVVVYVSWADPYVSSVSAASYFTRYKNTSYLETLAADFNAGINEGTTVTNNSGGEVILGAGGQGDWCKPSTSIVAQLDLPKQGVADAITAIEGRVFVGTGDNSSGVSFANVAISNANPPVPSIVGTFDGYKTNGVFGETDYAYIATDDPHKEVVIIDLRTKDANNKYSEIGFFNAPTNKKGDQVWVSGNVGYMITEKKLYSFDLTSKNGSRPILDPDGVTVGDGTRVVVVGTYAYVTIKGSSIELQIIDVINPNNLTIVGQADLIGKDAKDLFVNALGTRTYLVTGKQDTLPEFFIVDTSVKTGNRPVIGSYDANGMEPKAVTVVPGNRAIIVGKEGTANSEEYQVIDITNEASPIRCGGLNLGDQDVRKINGISSVLEADGDAYSYIMTGDSSFELKIIEGGPGGQYSSSGTFISATFDPGYQTAFNRFNVSLNRPNATDIKFQVAVSSAVGGSCNGASFSFVGPDSTSATFFTTSVTSGTQAFSYPIPITLNPGRCFKYKVYFSTTDFISSPIFYDIAVNYSL
ncbi:MAG: hypothetical protein HY426_01600 [Candidatus Levybacteria bacterium]|nr:hypothetical protein [Candidatus Levybacteria bacterium]